jgi:hypothetical protein
MKSQTESTGKRSGRLSTNIPIFLKPLSTLVLYAIGVAFGYIVIFLDYRFSVTEERHYQFLRNYQSQLWLLLLFMQIMFWAAVIMPIWRILRSLQPLSDLNWRIIRRKMWWKIMLAPILSFLSLGILFWILLSSSSRLSPKCNDYGFLHSSSKTTILTISGYCIALMAAIGLLLICIDLATLERGIDDKKRISKYIERRRHSLRLLTILGVMMGLATLGFGAKRNAILAMGQNTCQPDFSAARVFLLALYLTILLALTFFPTYAALLRTGRKLICDLLPMPSPSDKDWPNWYEKQKNLEELLRLSVTENLRAGVAILAPIAGSLISLLKG